MFGYIFELLVDLFLVNIQNKRILKYLPNEMNNIIDIGAHEGQLYKSMNKYNIKFNQMILFEPYEESFEKIKKINDNRVIAHNVGLGSSNENKELKINKYNVTNTFAEPNEKLLKNEADVLSIIMLIPWLTMNSLKLSFRSAIPPVSRPSCLL